MDFKQYCCCYGNLLACLLHISECRLRPVILSKCLGPAWFGRESEEEGCFSQIVQLVQIGRLHVAQPFGFDGEKRTAWRVGHSLLDLPPLGISPLPECSPGPAHLLSQPRGPQLLPWVRPRAGCEACVKRTEVGNLVPWTNLQTPTAQDFVSSQEQPKSSTQTLRVIILIYPKMLRIVP